MNFTTKNFKVIFKKMCSQGHFPHPSRWPRINTFNKLETETINRAFTILHTLSIIRIFPMLLTLCGVTALMCSEDPCGLSTWKLLICHLYLDLLSFYQFSDIEQIQSFTFTVLKGFCPPLCEFSLLYSLLLVVNFD